MLPRLLWVADCFASAPTLGAMNWVDLVILALVVRAAFDGRSEGVLGLFARYLGLAVGFVLGTLIAPSLATSFTSSAWRPALALVIVLVATVLGGRVGHLVGSLARRSFRALHLGFFDRTAGLLVGVAGTLVGCWLVAGILASTSWVSLAGQIQRSSILRVIDHVMPPVPSIETRVQSLFRNINFPSIFSSVVSPTTPNHVAPSSLGPTVSALSSPTNVVKVLASGGCARVQEGTAFFVSTHHVVTNAHVVAGERNFTVDGAIASVIYFNAQSDLAVLNVASLSQPPLSFVTSRVVDGTRAQVIGFPLNSTRRASPAYINGYVAGEGRDIYDDGLLTRTFEVVETNIQPGNSGSPVLVNGRVAGIIESTSLGQASTAYAIPNSVIENDLASVSSTTPVSTQGCVP